MRVLLAGATGFIGSALADSLRADGHEVVGLGRSASPEVPATISIEERRIDLGERSIEEFDVVYQLLGAPLAPKRWSAKRREQIRSSRITTTEILARAIALAETDPPAFVVGTAVGWYGSRGDELLDEHSSAGDGVLAELCRSWEAAAAPARAAGARVVTARTGVVIGAGGGFLAPLLPVFRAGLGARLGDGRQWLAWIALADEVRALRELGERPDATGPYNLVAPTPVRNSDFTALLAASLGRRARLVVPRLALRLGAGPVATDELLLASQRVVPRRLEQAEFSFTLPSLAEALAAATEPIGVR